MRFCKARKTGLLTLLVHMDYGEGRALKGGGDGGVYLALLLSWLTGDTRLGSLLQCSPMLVNARQYAWRPHAQRLAHTPLSAQLRGL